MRCPGSRHTSTSQPARQPSNHFEQQAMGSHIFMPFAICAHAPFQSAGNTEQYPIYTRWEAHGSSRPQSQKITEIKQITNHSSPRANHPDRNSRPPPPSLPLLPPLLPRPPFPALHSALLLLLEECWARRRAILHPLALIVHIIPEKTNAFQMRAMIAPFPVLHPPDYIHIVNNTITIAKTEFETQVLGSHLFLSFGE